MRKTVIETPYGYTVRLWRHDEVNFHASIDGGEDFSFPVPSNSGLSYIPEKLRPFFRAFCSIENSKAAVKAAKTYDWSKDNVKTIETIETPYGKVTLEWISVGQTKGTGFSKGGGNHYFPHSDRFLIDMTKPELLEFAKTLNRRFKDQAEVVEVAKAFKWPTRFGVKRGNYDVFRVTGVREKEDNDGDLICSYDQGWDSSEIDRYCPTEEARKFAKYLIVPRTPKTYEELVAKVEAYYAKPPAIEVGDYVKGPEGEGEATKVTKYVVEIDGKDSYPIDLVAKVEPERFEITQYKGSRGTIITKSADGKWNGFATAEEAIKASATPRK